MTEASVAALLGIAVLLAWLGAAGFARLRAPLDRMHAVTFVAAGSGAALALAALVSDGFSSRFIKAVLLVGFSLVSGAATAHAIGRALETRGSAPELEEEC